MPTRAVVILVAACAVVRGGQNASQPVFRAASISSISTSRFSTPIVGQTGSVELTRFNARTRSADLRVTLPIDRLPPSAYLPRAEASLASRKIERATRFAIK